MQTVLLHVRENKINLLIIKWGEWNGYNIIEQQPICIYSLQRTRQNSGWRWRHNLPILLQFLHHPRKAWATRNHCQDLAWTTYSELMGHNTKDFYSKLVFRRAAPENRNLLVAEQKPYKIVEKFARQEINGGKKKMCGNAVPRDRAGRKMYLQRPRKTETHGTEEINSKIRKVLDDTLN